MQKAIALALLLAMLPATAHAGQFEKRVFKDVREPYFEAPQEVEVPTDDWREVDRETFEAAYGPAEPSYDYEAPTYDYETPVYDYEPAAYDYAPTTYAPSEQTGDLRLNGVESDGEFTYTWYSQAALPGGALDIPGRHVGEGGYVMDGDGNICVASSDLPHGTKVDTPYGSAVVYDTGCAGGVVDVYTAW